MYLTSFLRVSQEYQLGYFVGGKLILTAFVLSYKDNLKEFEFQIQSLNLLVSSIMIRLKDTEVTLLKCKCPDISLYQCI